MSMKDELNRKKGLEGDWKRLVEIQEKVLKVQRERIEEKSHSYGSYRETDPKIIMENLGKNVVQFAMAYECGSLEDAMNQGADIINLVLMALDNIIVPD